jgi:O-antigen/teichoic acid export membrane protein
VGGIFKNTLIYTIGRIIPQLAGFLLLPLYTKYMSPTEYGIVQSLQTISVIITILFSLATERSMARLYFDYKTEREKKMLIGNANVLIFVTSTVFLGLSFLFDSQISKVYSSIDFYPFYVYSILNAYLLLFTQIPRVVLQTQEKAGEFFWSSITQFVGGVIFIVYFVVIRKEGAEGMLKGQLIGSAITLPWFIYLIRKQSIFTFNYAMMRSVFLYSIPLVPLLLFGWVNNLSGRIFIEQYFSLHDVGIYSLGYKIAGIVLLVVGSFYTAYSPVFYKVSNDQNEINPKQKLQQYNLVYILLIAFIGFAVALVGREIIILFLDKRYIDAWVIVDIICLVYVISNISSLFNLMIYQQKKTARMLMVVAASAVANVGFNFLLIPPYGYLGAAWSAVFTVLIQFILAYYTARRYYFIPFDWTRILAVIIPLTLICVLDLWVQLENAILSLSLKTLIILIIAGLMLYYFKPQLKAIRNYK